MFTNAELEHLDRTHVWHAFTQMQEYVPFIIERAQGCTLVDIHGQEYLDGVSSLWCNVHGHRHPRLDAALRAQLDKVAHVTSLGMSNPTTIELAKRLVDISPAGLNHVFFSDSGATAVEVALKIAFQYWRQIEHPEPERNKYIALDDAYHGDTIGSVSIGGVAQFHTMFKPLLFDVLRVPSPDAYRRPVGVSADQACGYYLAQLEALLQKHHREVAALVLEPLMQGAAGMAMQPAGYVRGVRELTKKYNVLLIADEVAVGMGRTGKMFACEHEGVTPDLLCLAKGLTGGYMPVAATLTTTEIWQAFLGDYATDRTLYHGHTFGGNPLGCAVALASLDVFEEEQTLANLQPKMARLAEHLARIGQHPHVGNARQCGLIGAVDLLQDKATLQGYPGAERRGHRACQHALKQGVWLRPLGNVVYIMPPLAITLDELDRICLAAEAGIEQATGA